MSKFELTDEQLIKKFQKGDIGAYNQIVYRYKDRLLNFIYRFLNDFGWLSSIPPGLILFTLIFFFLKYLDKYLVIEIIPDFMAEYSIGLVIFKLL